MLSVRSVDVSEGCIKGGQAKAPATKQTKERCAQYIDYDSMEPVQYGGIRLKSEDSTPEVANLSTPSFEWPCAIDDTPTGGLSPDYRDSTFCSPAFESSPPPHDSSRFNSDYPESNGRVEDAFNFLTSGSTPQGFLLSPNHRSDSSEFANFVFPKKSEALREPAENFSQVSLPCPSSEQCSSDNAPAANCPQVALTCEDFLDFDLFHHDLVVKIVAVTAKTNLSKKIDLEKLCEADSTHFGFRVAKLGPGSSQEAPSQPQDFRNSIQYLLALSPASCGANEKKFTGRIFNNGTVTISSLKIEEQQDITDTVGSCLHLVLDQIRSAHDASVASGSVVVLNCEAAEAGSLTFADPQFSLNLTFPLGYKVSYPKLRGIFKEGNSFSGHDETKIIINSTKEEQKCGQGVFLRVTQLKLLEETSEEFHASFTIFHTGTVQARATCNRLEDMEYLVANMYYILNLHRSEIEPAGPEEEFVSKRRCRKQVASARSHPYDGAAAQASAARQRKQPARA